MIFKTGSITYPKEWYIKSGLSVKPVVYTDNFLKEIASKTVGSSLELTHGNSTIDVIGHINEFDFNGDELLANVTTNKSLENMGFSPEFSANFIDKGDVYEAIDGQLIKTILTDKPRSHILYNSTSTSISTDDGGSHMNEELIETLNNQIKDLNKQVAQKEALIEANKKKLDEYNSLAKRVEELEIENNNFKTQIDGLKPKADAFAKIEQDKRAELLSQAFGDDEEAKKPWLDASMSQLESLAQYRETTKVAVGIGANNGEGIGEGSGEEETIDPAEKALEFYKKTHNGEVPSFLKNKED